MTDIRRPSIAALQGSLTDLQLRIIHRVACTNVPEFVLHIVGKWLGIIPSDYGTSEEERARDR